jgi:ATP-dependent Clp protease ATP-binding subunit ClpC
LLLFGFAAGYMAAQYWRGAAARPAGRQVAAAAAAPSQPTAILPRAERLHELTIALDQLIQSSAHPNALKGFAKFDEAVAILADQTTPLSEVLDYARGTSIAMADAAFSALARRADGADVASVIPTRFDSMAGWQIQYALEYLAGLKHLLPAGTPLLGHQNWWDDTPAVKHVFDDYFTALEKRGVEPEPGTDVAALALDRKQRISYFLGQLRHPMAARLAKALGGSSVARADAGQGSNLATLTGLPFLQTIGRFWGEEQSLDRPIVPTAWSEFLADSAKTLERTPIRSLLVAGEPLVGKTSFLHLLAQRHEVSDWRVFEASGTDLQAGQFYIGQLEGRIRQAVEELAASKKMIWYVPDLLALALSGTNQSQSASILDQILPAITAGRLVVWSEASPKSAARLMQLRPAVRRLFEVVHLDALDREATRPLARDVALRLEQSLKLKIDPGFTEAAIDAGRHYLTASCMPGSVIGLMKIAALRSQKTKAGRLSDRDILDALAQLTGLPQSIIDGSERLNLAETTAYFSKRVIGQPDAVATIVERIAMLKSGLNDPGKPFGVFLFAGPTGTGKTELTKAIAEFLFGSIERMIRLDMSEYQAHDSIGKIIGGSNQPPDSDTLISRIRKQPFSLILLDEFEKSNPNVWDLFLQVFDEGRLTDMTGQTADFRHCLIILTTNLGATSHQSSGLGFAPRQNAYTNEQVLRSIGQTFRPEFQNRIDKIIVFRPLTREHMRGILKKELDRLFERRGLKDREWAVEWESSALEFLLEKGFSLDMGARPLKRAIDQYVVAPIAAAIVERRAPEGEQFVFVRSDGVELQAEFVDPDGEGDPVPLDAIPASAAAAGEPPTLASVILAPQVTPGEIALLTEREAACAERIEADTWVQQKMALSEAINDPAFWSRADRFDVLARFELMDRLAVAAGTARSLQARLAKGRVRPGKAARELVGRLAQQVWLVGEGLRDLDESAPVEVALLVEPALEGSTGERGISADWRREIVDMYRSWTRRRGMQLVEIEAEKSGDSSIQLVAGFGAHRILSREAGLHVLEQSENGGSPSRIAVRVLVSASPPGELSRTKRREALFKLFKTTPRTSTVVRRYRREPSPLVRSADGSWRSGKLDAILAGDFDIVGGAVQ